MIRGTAHRYRIQWLLLGIALLPLAALIGYSLNLEYSRIDALERDRLQVQARVVDENLGRQMEGVNHALAGIRDEFVPWGGKKMEQEASRHLKALTKSIPGLRTIGIFDVKGTMLVSNRDELNGRDISEREYFRIASARPNPDTLYVSPPFRTALDVFSINLTRAVVGPKGEFAGAVTATLDPEYFAILLKSVLYTPGMRSSIIHGDGKIVVEEPDRKDLAGTDLARPSSRYTLHVESAQAANVFTGTAYSTGDQRMSAWRTIRPASLGMDKPLMVSVTRDMAGIFTEWHRHAYVQSGLFGALLLISTSGVFLYQRRQMAHGRIDAGYATERKRAEDALRNSSKRLRELSQRLIEIEDAVRRNINRELHDRVGANLSALNLSLSIVRSQLPQESLRAVGARLQDTQRLLEETTMHVRDLMADLHPPALDDYGLLPALRTWIQSFGARVVVPISVHGEDLVPRLPLPVETAAFRVAQGALVNAVTHARAKRIEIVFAASPDTATLTIADDGVGFDVTHAAQAHASWGLAIMRERAEAVGATLTVEAAPGKRTRVCVEIPRKSVRVAP